MSKFSRHNFLNSTTLLTVVALCSIIWSNCSRSIQDSKPLSEKQLEVDSLNRRVNFFKTRNLDSAFTLAKYCLNESTKMNYKRGEAISLAKLSYLYHRLGDYDTALHFTQRSHRIRESLNDNKLIAGSYIHFSKIFIALEQFPEAAENVSKSLAISLTLQDTTGTINAYNQQGIIMGMQNKHHASLESFHKAFSLARSINDSFAIIRCMDNLGVAHKQLQNYDSSYLYFSSAMEFHKKRERKSEVAGLKTNMANVQIATGKTDEGISLLKEAYNDAKAVKNNRYISTSLSSIARYYDDKRNIDSAYKYLVLLNDHEDSTHTNNVESKIADAHVKFNTERIQLKNKIQQQQIEKDNRTKKILLSTLIAVLIAALLVLRNIQQKRKLAEKDAELQRQKIDKLLQKHEMKIFEAMVNGQEEERHRIAEDLHDRLGSILSAIKLHFNGIEEILSKNNISRPKQVEKTHQMLDVASQEVRSISHDMLSNTLVKFGLVPALNDLSETIVTSGQLEMEIFEHGLSNRLDNKVEITIYRVVQELVANILKHAEASKITIELNVIDGQLNLIVHDDGKGFDSEKHLSIGVGLQNVRNRLSTIGGEMIIDSKPNKGTSTIIEIQLNQDHD